MPFTNSDWLPTYEELNVQELEVTSSVLRAGAHHLGKYCDSQCKEFMLCMAEEEDPRKCLKEGKDVTKCGVHFFQKVKQHCAEEFTQYWKCVDVSRFDMRFKTCRKLQAAFDKCIFDNFGGQERPPLGYFSKTRVHHTNRPKPKFEENYPEKAPEHPRYDPDKPLPESARQGRLFSH